MSNISLDFFETDLEKKVKKIASNVKLNDELEVSFGDYKKPITLKMFNKLLKYFNLRSKKENLKTEISKSLDINYNYDEKTSSSYRISIFGYETIENFIENNSLLKNHTIFSRKIRMLNSGDIIINKVKSPEKYIFLNNYDIRIKYSEEKEIEQSALNDILKLDESERFHILFRYKQRVSLIIDDNPDYIIRLDLTDVRSDKNINNLLNNSLLSNIELEVDVSFKKPSFNKEVLNILAENIFKLEQFLQESRLLITKTEASNVIKNLNKLAYDDENENYKDLPAMQTASVDIQSIIDTIPGNYTATDKADGDRYFLIIYDSSVYLVSGNLHVKKIKDKDNKYTPYNLTVLDGEYLYIPKYGKFLFLTFDILFFQGKDTRTTESLKERLLLAARTLKDLFDVHLEVGLYTKEYNLTNIFNFHKNNMIEHIKQLNKKLEDKKSDNQIINGKYFIFPMTVSAAHEIYSYSTLLWELYTNNSDVKCPYILDGIIYTPINQKYTKVSRDIKFKILKWKPESHNSLDFYVQYERNPETKKVMTVYDRVLGSSLEEYIDEHKSDKIDFTDMTTLKSKAPVYQIINLFVGKMKNNQETPILFKRDQELHQAFIYLEEGKARDLEGNIIMDNTVVEFAYNNNCIDPKLGWIPMRTRYDKTESVMKYKRKYGNNSEIANNVWESIKNPITYDDIKLLGDSKTNATHVKLLKTKITSESIALARRNDSYYQIVSNLGKSMRNFHNWIKSNMIYTYCSKKTLMDNSKVAMDILDIGFGRGGDLMKLYHAKIKSATASDINEAGIYSGSDGAISRYNVLRKKMPHFPKISFVVADAGTKLDYENQENIMGKGSEQNAKMIKQIFGENERSNKIQTYDVINAQFMIHYLLRDKTTWKNFCSNVNKYLRKDGYLLITTLDGSLLNSSFGKSGRIYRDYIDEEGQKRVLFEVIRKYPEDLDLTKLKTVKSNLGIQIDVNIPIFMEEGTFHTEYLVNPSFLINSLRNDCNMRLVETESFQNLHYVYEDFFTTTAQFESKQETRTFFNNVKEFYNFQDDITKKMFEYSKLNRYFIFQKLN
jgi:hypothetical protein